MTVLDLDCNKRQDIESLTSATHHEVCSTKNRGRRRRRPSFKVFAQSYRPPVLEFPVISGPVATDTNPQQWLRRTYPGFRIDHSGFPMNKHWTCFNPVEIIGTERQNYGLIRCLVWQVSRFYFCCVFSQNKMACVAPITSCSQHTWKINRFENHLFQQGKEREGENGMTSPCFSSEKNIEDHFKPGLFWTCFPLWWFVFVVKWPQETV